MTIDEIKRQSIKLLTRRFYVGLALFTVSMLFGLPGWVTAPCLLGCIAWMFWWAEGVRRYQRRILVLPFVAAQMEADGIEHRTISNGYLDALYAAGVGRPHYA